MGTARRVARFPKCARSWSNGCLFEIGIPERALAKENCRDGGLICWLILSDVMLVPN